MSNKHWRKKPEGSWLVMLVLPLDQGRNNIRVGKFNTKAEARKMLSKILRGFLLDRAETGKQMLLNRVHVSGADDTHLYFMSEKALLPVFMMTKSEKEFAGPISLMIDRLGGVEELGKRAAPFVAAWCRAMALLEQKRGNDAYTRRKAK